MRSSRPCFRKTRSASFTTSCVHARENPGHELDDRDARAEPAPDAAELEADHATADDDEMLRHLGDRERADVGEHALLVELEKGQLDGHRAGRDDDVLRGVRRRGAVGAGDVDEVAGAQRPAPLGPRDLVLPEQELDPLRVLRHDFVLALEHLREVDAQIADTDAVLGGVLAEELDMLRGVQQRLGRDAADVDAGAAERLVHLDADGDEAELGGADRGDIAARAAADDHDVGGSVRSHGLRSESEVGRPRGI